jgi:hypothetical protein
MVHRTICRLRTDRWYARIYRIVNSRAALAALVLFVVPVMQFHLAKALAQLAREPLSIITQSGKLDFEIEVAETPEQKAKGLMFRRSLGERTGMLFPYGQSQEITMWMKNTYIPLDMLFIRGDGIIHRIEEMTQPFSEEVIASKGSVTAVLEIAGGGARKLGIKPGDKVLHPAFKTAAR